MQGAPQAYAAGAGLRRVWYDNLPPSRQPAPVDCREAERIASRYRGARVIYGPPVARPRPYGNRGPYGYPPSPPRYDARGPRWGGADDYRYGYGSGYGYPTPAFDRGFRDGLEKGREDARDRDSYDPVRHRWYRSGDRGYERRYGLKDAYRNIYREGFKAGYDEAFGYRSDRWSGGFWLGWRR
jgi:hypothetical protein